MSAIRATVLGLVVAVLAGTARGATVDVPPMSPQERDAMAAYLKDPATYAKPLLDAAPAPGPEMNPVYALMLGDAAIRQGRYRTATEFLSFVQDSGLTGAAEVGLAWASLGRGRLTEASDHFEAAATLDPALKPLADFATAIVAAANGSNGPTAIADATQGNIDPAFREVAPLLEAYARYWSGDATGAAQAFMAFAVAHPDSRYTDDALYAAAQAKYRAGLDAESRADLEALVGDQPPAGKLSSRLVELDGRALLREGMRRDRERPMSLLPQRLANLLDGDGIRLAQAALAARDKPEQADPTDADDTVPTGHPAGHRVARNETAAAGSSASAAARSHPAGAQPGDGAHAVPSAPAAASGARFPWTVVIAVVAALLLLGLWLFGRGARTDQARSR